MPNRIIKESIKTSPEIDRLSWFEECFYYRLMVTADDYGRVDGRIVLLKNELFPLKEDVKKKDVEDALNHLISAGLLHRYEVDGLPYLVFPTWEKHQRIRNKHSKFPAPVGDLSDTCQTVDGQMTASCLSESEYEIESESEYEVEDEARGRARVTPPTMEEVDVYIREKGYSISAQRFCSYYRKRKWNGVDNWREKVDEWSENDIQDKHPVKRESSFDSDAFMIAALKRTYGEAGA